MSISSLRLALCLVLAGMAATSVGASDAGVVADRGADLGTRLAAAVRLGRVGAASASALRAAATDQGGDLVMRGYAAWAADQIASPTPRTGRTFHVSQRDPRASDASAGTASRPWRTIQRAAETLRAGDTVLIHDGLYREFVWPFLDGELGRPITYRAAPGQHPVLTGADAGRHPGPTKGTANGLPRTGIIRGTTRNTGRRPSTGQSIVRSRSSWTAACCVRSIPEMNYRAAPASSGPTTARIGSGFTSRQARRRPAARSSAMRPQVFAPAVRGLCYLWAAAIGHDPSVGAEPGFHVLRHNRISHQGIAGIVAFSANQLLLEDNETDFNGEKGDFAGYESAGVKFHDAQDCLIRRHTAVGNRSFGIWFDLHACHDRVTQCVLKDNLGAGLMYELSGGPFLADDNVIVGTGAAPGDPGWADGIYSHDGSGAVYLHNYIADCTGFGVRLQNTFGRKDLDGQPTSHNRVWNNYLWDDTGGAVSFNPDVPLAEDNRSDANLLWQRGGPVTCRLDESGFDAAGLHWDQTTAGEALGTNGSAPMTLPLVRWQQVAGQDHDSLALPRSTAFPSPDLGPVRDRLTRLQTVLFPALSGDALDPPPAPVSAAQMETAIGQVSASGAEISKEKEQQR